MAEPATANQHSNKLILSCCFVWVRGSISFLTHSLPHRTSAREHLAGGIEMTTKQNHGERLRVEAISLARLRAVVAVWHRS